MTTPEDHPQVVLRMGGAWHEPELRRWKHSPRSLAGARKRFEILAWRDRFGGWHYPKWQFGADGRVLPEVAAIVRMYRSRDVLYVMSQFLYSEQGHKPLIELIQSGRGAEAVALATERVRELRAEPPLPAEEVAILKQRMSEYRDATRYVVVSSLLSRWALVYDLSSNTYCHEHISDGCLIKDERMAEAIASQLRGRKRKSDLHVLPVRRTKRGYRALADLPGCRDGKPWRPRFRTPDSTPVFVAITPEGTRANIIDVMLFGARHREALLSLLAKSPNRKAAKDVLVAKCGLSSIQADVVLDLRLSSMTKSAIDELTEELRKSVAPNARSIGSRRRADPRAN